MKFLSIFDVIGPNMIGPSSSHTAGAASIGLFVHKMFGRPIKKATFILYGSFARTYQGHGTDRALLGGVLGFATDDERIRDAFSIAEKMGIEYRYIIDSTTQTAHPNTADIILESPDGHTLSVRGESTGGGKIQIVRINQIEVAFTGEYSTLICVQKDVPGVITHITSCLSAHNVNIAFMRLFREKKGKTAYTVIESDEFIPEEILKDIESNPHIYELMLIEDY
ncbi:MAG: L-serine ammonia-lyase, iron-sulfur-dependent subunit beta [Lachnospiraceae bacterium]|nr:L-serine ammonia-lyase, iron-sulfur-dependent subunit beta [Lachnospiraceae bacterium]